MSDPVRVPLRVSVIVPAWNDHVSLARLLPALVRLKGLYEVIVADASPHSATAESARTGGAIYLAARQPNRGAQMNLAAENATGDVLIFHHADSILTAAHVAAIEKALRNPETIGGAFYRKFDGRHPRLRWLEVAGRFFTRHGGSFFGDQSIFVRRETFRAVGGFAPIPLMEDMEFSRRLRRAGKVERHTVRESDRAAEISAPHMFAMTTHVDLCSIRSEGASTDVDLVVAHRVADLIDVVGEVRRRILA